MQAVDALLREDAHGNIPGCVLPGPPRWRRDASQLQPVRKGTRVTKFPKEASVANGGIREDPLPPPRSPRNRSKYTSSAADRQERRYLPTRNAWEWISTSFYTLHFGYLVPSLLTT